MIKKIVAALILLACSIIGNAQQNNTFLWRINNPSTQNVSYLFGTIHLPQEKFMSVSDSVYNAINNTNVFYGELDYLNMYKDMGNSEDFFQSKIHYIDSVKKTASWKRMIATINRTYHASINPDSLEEFTQFGQNLLADYMESEPGVKALDIALYTYALEAGKKTKGLESFIFQLDMLYKIIDARLTDTTLLFNDDITIAANMKRFYTTQQFDSMTTIIESVNDTYRKIVFDDRNSIMADSIENISKNNTAFFAVGCGHLLGKKGIINLLKARGLQLTPVFSSKKYSVTAVLAAFKSTMKSVQKSLREEDEVIPEEKIEQMPIAPPPPPLKKKAPVKKSTTKKQ